MITLTAAATIVSTLFGFLMRDLVNFGKVEGDKRPAALEKSEKRIFAEVLEKLKKAKLDKEEISEDILNELETLLVNTRKISVGIEQTRIEAYGCEDKGDIDGALAKLQEVSDNLQRAISLIPDAEPEIRIVDKEGGEKEVVLLPNGAIALAANTFRAILEDVDADIARINAKKELAKGKAK